MKIDLHIHTQKLKKGEKKKNRDINPADFVRKMFENNIGIMSITNHNKFDINEYNEILEIKPDLNIFPGIELDVKEINGHYHIIVVVNPKIKNEFYEIFDNDPQRNYNDYYLKYETFIEKVKLFNPDDILIIPHFADKDRAIGNDFFKGPKNDLKNYVVIFEPAKLHTMGMINAHGHLSLIGSDLQDWDKYHEEAIPVLKFKIENFEKFHELAKNPSSFITKAINNTVNYNISFNDLNGLFIYEDLNILFGEKGSGKTVLLKRYLEPFFNSIGKKTFLHEGKEYSKIYTNILENIANKLTIDEDRILVVERLITEQLKYQEDQVVNFVEQYNEYHNNISDLRNRTRLLKADSTYTEMNHSSFQELFNGYDQDEKILDKVLLINGSIPREIIRKTALREEVLHLKTDLKMNLKNKILSIFMENSIIKFLNNLKTSADKNSGSKSKPLSIGFASLISKRLKLIEDNMLLNETLNSFETEVTKKIGVLPGKGNINLNIKIQVMNENSISSSGGFKRNSIKSDRKIVKKIKKFNIDAFREINSYFDSDEKQVNVNVLVSNIIIKTTNVVFNGGIDYEPSEGEQAILSITGILESYDYDVYLFDEIERGLGNRYITDYVIPQVNKLVDAGKTVVISTHNANLAINSLPINFIYCDYRNANSEIYYSGNMFENRLEGVVNKQEIVWENKALKHLEGSDEMFKRRKNIYGV